MGGAGRAVRSFSDPEGRPWDVVLGRESWGTHYAIFVPAGAGRPESPRQTMLRSGAYDAAWRELEELDDAGLTRLFQASEPKP